MTRRPLLRAALVALLVFAPMIASAAGIPAADAIIGANMISASTATRRSGRRVIDRGSASESL